MSSSATRMQETRGIKPRQTFSGHTNWVTGVIHLPDGQRIVTSSFAGSPRVLNLQGGKQIPSGWQNEELYPGQRYSIISGWAEDS
jgi:WD40 repeat protein